MQRVLLFADVSTNHAFHLCRTRMWLRPPNKKKRVKFKACKSSTVKVV